MIIIDKPYISEFLIETIKKNDFKVLLNEVSKKYFAPNTLLTPKEFIEAYKENKSIYMNSENSLNWVCENLGQEKISKLIDISKNKILFREKLKNIYPNYYFENIELKNLKNKNPKEIKYPIILKPAVGFLSLGVYTIENENQWIETVDKIQKDIKQFSGIFPTNVVDTTNFIIEELIKGDEYAIDAYFNNKGEAVILNIFRHPFLNSKDVSDRLYYTSKEILSKYLNKFEIVLNQIGKIGNFKNFPLHLELRENEDNIIPIEINPMRFCGWCITDIAHYAWGINVYEYFLQNKKPNWKTILKNSDSDFYYFTIGEIPSNIKNSEIKEILYDKYLENISNPLDIRKIDYKHNPIFAIVFGKTNDYNEITNLLTMKTDKYIVK